MLPSPFNIVIKLLVHDLGSRAIQRHLVDGKTVQGHDVTFFPEATISMAFGNTPAVFTLRTDEISLSEIIFWIDDNITLLHDNITLLQIKYQ